MCYTGQCPYEDRRTGGCTIQPTYSGIKVYPLNAHCVDLDNEIEEGEEDDEEDEYFDRKTF